MAILLDNLERIVDNTTYEVKYTFTGSITPECIQDVIHGSFGMSHEQLGIMIIEDLKELYKEMLLRGKYETVKKTVTVD